MLHFVLFFLLLWVLYFVSRRVKKGMYRLLLKLLGSERAANYVYSFLFLPGTLFHELSHVLAAVVLLVPVKKISLLPKMREGKIVLGSVTLSKVDMVRETIVGLSPYIFGVISLLVLSGEVVKYQTYDNYLLLALFIYLIFQVSNSMFLSKSDLLTAVQLMLVVIVILAVLYIFGIEIDLSVERMLSDQFRSLIVRSSYLLFIPLIVDGALLILIKLIPD